MATKKSTTKKVNTKTTKTTTKSAPKRATKVTATSKKSASAKTSRTKNTRPAKSTKQARVAANRNYLQQLLGRVRGKSAAKTTAAKVKRGSTPKKAVLAEGFKSLNLITAAVFVVLAVLAGVLMSNHSAPLSVSYLGKDTLASRTSTEFAPASQAVASVEIRTLVISVLLLSAVLPVLFATKWRNRYENALVGRVLTWRWIDLAVTHSLIIATVALLSGVDDIMTVKLVAGFVVLSAALSWVAERRNQGAKKPSLTTYFLSLAALAVPAILIAVYALSTWVYGMIRYPWYVYALYIILAAGAVMLALNQYRQHVRLKKWSEYAYVERNYIYINLAIKTLFAVILIVGLQQ